VKTEVIHITCLDNKPDKTESLNYPRHYSIIEVRIYPHPKRQKKKMYMRRYGMESPGVHRLKLLLRRDSINVKKIVVAAHDKREDSVYVFYEHAEEEEKKERVILEQLKAKGEEIAKDKVYPKLKNIKQRELYLFDHYGLSKRESVDVIELVKMIEIGALMVEKAEEKIKKKEEKDETIQGIR
jgi:hypothetical protein